MAALAHVISSRCLSMYFCLRKSNVFDWQHLIMLLISGVKVCFLKPARATCGKSRCRPFLFKSQPTRCCTCIFVAACLIRWAHRYESMFFSCIFVVACRVPWQLWFHWWFPAGGGKTNLKSKISKIYYRYCDSTNKQVNASERAFNWIREAIRINRKLFRSFRRCLDELGNLNLNFHGKIKVFKWIIWGAQLNK